MVDSPRRRRADGWVWVCLALFNADDDSTNKESTSSDQTNWSAGGPSDNPEMRV